jgi:cyclic pyranopterin phosphate synthase
VTDSPLWRICGYRMSRLQLPIVGRVTAAANAGADPLVDTFARRIRYLRVSVTDRCNYRCTYCMPESLHGEVTFQPRASLLTFEELEQLVSIFARLGVRKVRLTGGEPTARRGLVDLAARLARVPGIVQLVMTTNGHILDELAAPLTVAGLTAVNISVDSLDPDVFRQLTGRGDLKRVLAGVDAAVAAGLSVKLNTVALRGVNEAEIPALCAYAWARGVVPRFIEHMPMSDGRLYSTEIELPAKQIREAIAAVHGPLAARVGNGTDAGPARYWTTTDGRVVGIISAMTEHFCGDCNRLRLTAVGELHACLGHDDAISLRHVLRGGGSDDDVIRAIAGAVSGKRAGHTFALDGSGAPRKHMIGMGG